MVVRRFDFDIQVPSLNEQARTLLEDVVGMYFPLNMLEPETAEILVDAIWESVLEEHRQKAGTYNDLT